MASVRRCSAVSEQTHLLMSVCPSACHKLPPRSFLLSAETLREREENLLHFSFSQSSSFHLFPKNASTCVHSVAVTLSPFKISPQLKKCNLHMPDGWHSSSPATLNYKDIFTNITHDAVGLFVSGPLITSIPIRWVLLEVWGINESGVSMGKRIENQGSGFVILWIKIWLNWSKVCCDSNEWKRGDGGDRRLHLPEGKPREKNLFHLLVAVTKQETFPNVTSGNILVGRTRVRCSTSAPPEISSFGSSSCAIRFLR